jgi:hypothetical protein
MAHGGFYFAYNHQRSLSKLEEPLRAKNAETYCLIMVIPVHHMQNDHTNEKYLAGSTV